MQVNDTMVAKAAEALRLCAIERGHPVHPAVAQHLAVAAITAALAEMWRPVRAAEPNQTYLLGWHDWRDHAWCTEVAPAIHGQRFENGYSNVSQHGSATHYMPLPAPPKTGGE